MLRATCVRLGNNSRGTKASFRLFPCGWLLGCRQHEKMKCLAEKRSQTDFNLTCLQDISLSIYSQWKEMGWLSSLGSRLPVSGIEFWNKVFMMLYTYIIVIYYILKASCDIF